MILSWWYLAHVCFKLGATLDTTVAWYTFAMETSGFSKIFCWVQGSERYVPQADTTQGPGCLFWVFGLWVFSAPPCQQGNGAWILWIIWRCFFHMYSVLRGCKKLCISMLCQKERLEISLEMIQLHLYIYIYIFLHLFTYNTYICISLYISYIYIYHYISILCICTYIYIYHYTSIVYIICQLSYGARNVLQSKKKTPNWWVANGHFRANIPTVSNPGRRNWRHVGFLANRPKLRGKLWVVFWSKNPPWN